MSNQLQYIPGEKVSKLSADVYGEPADGLFSVFGSVLTANTAQDIADLHTQTMQKSSRFYKA